MRRVSVGILAAAGMTLGVASAAAASGKADLLPTKEGSKVAGTALLADTPGGLAVEVHVTGALPGQHGLHIHEFGDCGGGGDGAGGHFNPAQAPHGFYPNDGPERAHPGDMGNIEVAADGAGMLSVTLPGVTLSSGPRAVAGRAIVLHEKVDDFGQPTGNAGGRIGCGPIVLMK